MVTLLQHASRVARGLLVGLLGAGALAGAPAAGQERVQGDVYTNARYGIQISKPTSWHFMTAGMIVDLAKRTGGGNPVRGEEDPVKLAGFAVVVSKVPTLGREIAPQVFVLIHEVKERPTDIAKACEGLRSGMSDPETVQPTREVRVEGRPGVRLDFRGLVDGAMVRATALCTFRERQAFVIAAQALSADFDREAAIFETVLASFKLK
ncbi:MAG: hypothetical protein ACRELA_10220 [Candidatus Rokuibacteriota bacterium]